MNYDGNLSAVLQLPSFITQHWRKDSFLKKQYLLIYNNVKCSVLWYVIRGYYSSKDFIIRMAFMQ